MATIAQLEAGIIQVCNADDIPRGMGFVIGSSRIITCAHVISLICGLGKIELPQEAPKVKVTVVFPFLRQKSLASVAKWYPQEDVAILEVDNMPVEARPMNLVLEYETFDHKILAYANETWTEGRTLYRVMRENRVNHSSRPFLQIEILSNSPLAEEGFSGAPVIHRDSNSVIGMVAETKRNREEEKYSQRNRVYTNTTYAIPTSEIYALITDVVEPPQRLVSNRVTWNRFRDKCHEWSTSRFVDVDKEIAIHRPYQEAVVNSFLTSNSKFLIITGNSGVGKSFLTYNIVNDLMQKITFSAVYYPYYILHGDNINFRDFMFEHLSQMMQSDLHNVLPDINNRLSENNRMVIFIDGIENCNYTDIFEGLDRLSDEIENPNLKFIIACWPNVWGNVAREGFPISKCYSLPGNVHYLYLNRYDHVEVEHAWMQYISKYSCIAPRYQELPENLKDAVRDPLYLKLLAEINQNKEIELPTDNIIEAYLQHSVENGLLKKLDLEFLNSVVIPYFADKNHCIRSIRVNDILDQCSLDEKQSLRRLVKRGILECRLAQTESYQNIEDNLQGNLSFAYDRFQNYLIGKYIREFW